MTVRKLTSSQRTALEILKAHDADELAVYLSNAMSAEERLVHAGTAAVLEELGLVELFCHFPPKRAGQWRQPDRLRLIDRARQIIRAHEGQIPTRVDLPEKPVELDDDPVEPLINVDRPR